MKDLETITTRHLAARTWPEIYRPLVDVALLRIGEYCKADLRAFKNTLDAIELTSACGRTLGPWGYVEAAMAAIRPFVMGPRLRDALGGCDWFVYFVEGGVEEYRGHVLVENAQALPMDALLWGEPVFLESYPEEAWPFLMQQSYIGGYDADVLGLWRQPGGYTSLCHAHPEGFWVLGRDPVDFVEQVAGRLDWIYEEPCRPLLLSA